MQISHVAHCWTIRVCRASFQMAAMGDLEGHVTKSRLFFIFKKRKKKIEKRKKEEFFFFIFFLLSFSFFCFFFYFFSNCRATYKFPQRLGNRQHSGSDRKSGRLPPAGGQELGIWLEASAWQHEWSTEWHGSFPIVPPASHVHISELGD